MIAQLLPHRERFAHSGAGAVGLVAWHMGAASRYRDRIGILGAAVDAPLDPARFVPVLPGGWWYGGGTARYLSGAACALQRLRPGLIEVHNRPAYVRPLRRSLPDVRLMLYLHNDPRAMRGARSPKERRQLLGRLDAIVCVSSFIRDCFLEDVDDPDGKLEVVHNAVDMAAMGTVDFAAKRKEIIFVGRTIPDKGMHLLVEAARTLLPAFPDWRVTVVGGRRFSAGSVGERGYEREQMVRLSELGAQAEIAGYLSHSDTLARLKRAAIAVLPSLWDEPCGLTHMEAMAAGCALVTTRRGGIPEIAGDAAHYLESENAAGVAARLLPLMTDLALLRRSQERAHRHAEARLDIQPAVERLDAIRARCLARPA